MSDGPILVVEDDPDIRDTMVEFLAMEGYETYSAANGLEALNIIADVDRQLPKFISLDYQMPIMDGREFLSHLGAYLAQRNASQPIPVAVLTAVTGKARAEIQCEGIQIYSKPLDVARFLSIVRESCG